MALAEEAAQEELMDEQAAEAASADPMEEEQES